MGLRRVWIAVVATSAVAVAPVAVAAPHEPVVFALGWGEVPEQFFPHPSVCVGAPDTRRQVALGGGFLLDPDGCGGIPRGRIAYQDTDGSGSWTRGDGVYLQAGQKDRVGPGDLRVQAGVVQPAAVAVRASDRDAGLATVALAAPKWDFVDVDRSGRWSTGDTLYLDGDGNGFFSLADLVLDGVLTRPASDASGMAYPFLPGEAAICFVDDDGSADRQPAEPVYLVAASACEAVRPGDLRLVATAGYASGTTVRNADRDPLFPLSPLPAGSMLGGTLDNGTIGIDLDGSGGATQGDLFVGVPMVRVGAGAPEAPYALAGAFRILDLDASGAASEGDAFYLDRDGDRYASIGDVRFAAVFGMPYGSVVEDGDVDAVAPLPRMAHAPAGGSTGTGDAAAGEQGSTSRGSPAPSPLFLMVLLALLGLCMTRQRKTS